MSVLDGTDNRPVLVSILGGAWILMGFFGVIQGAFLAAGLNDRAPSEAAVVERAGVERVDVPSASGQRAVDGGVDSLDVVGEDPSARLAEIEVEGTAMDARYRALNRSFGVPWVLVSLVAGVGGLRLIRRRSWSRSLVLAGGLGAVALAVWHAYLGLQITLGGDAEGLMMPDERRLSYLTAIAGAMLNSVPAVVGVVLLRHRAVGEWVRGDGPRGGLGEGESGAG